MYSLRGLCIDEILDAINSGKILIPEMSVVPTDVTCNADQPPEIEVRFDMKPDMGSPCHQWKNWQIAFVHNQLFDHFVFPARFCPGPNHMTIVRKASFRSEEHRIKYFEKCSEVVKKWEKIGPQILVPESNPNNPGYISEPLGEELSKPGGIYLFKSRNEILHYFPPNFLPPYNTPDKIRIIKETLSKRWDPDLLQYQQVMDTDLSMIQSVGLVSCVPTDSGCGEGRTNNVNVPCLQL